MSLEIAELSKIYRKIIGIEDLTINALDGETIGIAGLSSSGKTTVASLLAGLIKPTDGQVILDDQVFKPRKMKNRRKIFYVPADLTRIQNMRIAQLITINLRKYHIANRRVTMRTILEEVKVEPRTPFKALSLVKQKLILLKTAQASQARIVIWDEPSLGLSERMAAEFWATFQTFPSTTIKVFTSSIFTDVAHYSDQIVYLVDGQVRAVEKAATFEDLYARTIRIKGHLGDFEMVRQLGGQVLQETDDEIRIYYPGSIQAILPFLQVDSIKDLLITEPTLEERLATL